MGNVITAGRLQCNERGDVNIKDDTVTVTVVYIREREWIIITAKLRPGHAMHKSRG